MPVTAALPLSGPPYVGACTRRFPDVASLPVNVTVTGALYQPLPFGPRSGGCAGDGRCVLVDLELELGDVGVAFPSVAEHR